MMAIATRCGLSPLRFVCDIQINITDKVCQEVVSGIYHRGHRGTQRKAPQSKRMGWSLRSLRRRLRNQLEKILGYAICRVSGYRSFVQIIPEHRAHA